MKTVLFIGFGGFIGGIMRYYIASGLQPKNFMSFPIGILGVNILGCFFMGLILGASFRMEFHNDWKIFFIAVCGGFTTFSAFSADTFFFLNEGKYLYALSYIFVSVFFCTAATFLGYYFFK